MESIFFMYNLKASPKDNIIHETAIIHPTAIIGEGNYIGPYCVIAGNVQIGNYNRIEGFCSIGSPPEHKDFYNGSSFSVEIGDKCVIREHVTINAGISSSTIIGNEVQLLHGAYLAHDCRIGSFVTVSGHTAIAGHCEVFQGANLGLNVSVHQYSVIGHYAMIGMGTVITKTSIIEPVKTYVGSPARYLKINQYAIEKYALDLKSINDFNTEFVARRALGKIS